MSSKLRPKDVLLVTGTARGGKFSTGNAKPVDLVSTPESKLKSTPDQKSTSSQSPTPVKVPHYLRASTGSCHDFCKYGGWHSVEEEERKGGSHSSKKKIGLRQGPKWKDIPSYDAIPKTEKPQVVPLDSKKVGVPAKQKLERPTGLARQNLQRRVSLEASCSGTKPVVSTPVKNSSAPAKSKAGRPGIIHKKSAAISSRPKIQEMSEENINKGPTGTVRNCAEVNMGPIHTTDGNVGEGDVERTLYVVEPELKLEMVRVNHDFYEEKRIEELKPDIKVTSEIDFGIEEPKRVETNEVSQREDNVIVRTPLKCLLSETDKGIQESSAQVSGDWEIVVELDTELGGKINNYAPNEGTLVESEREENKNSDSEDEAIPESGSNSSESGEKSEPDSELDFESSAEEEQSMESDSESESSSLSISRSASSGSVGSASKNEKPKVECSNQRRSSSNQLEEKKPYKLRFKPGRVIDIKPDSEHGPRRLKFRKPRVAREEGGNHKSSSDARKVSYRKLSGSIVTASSSVDQKSAGVILRHQDEKERKEGQNGLFNIVIEETASKLVETRKSKVKALVGAFETVISLQDGKSTSSA
jgi:Plant calmodulin-binding domain